MSNCIEWPRYKNLGGYGKEWRNGKTYLAHRLAYTDAYGPIPKGMIVMHTCDNPACVNIDHLQLGTLKDNSQDMLNKERQARGITSGMHKLTEAEVLEIRKDPRSLRKIAEDYKVDHTTISRIKKRDNWKHI